MRSSSDGTAAAPPRTPVTGAFLEGWRRVLRAPALSASIVAATFLCALPLAMSVSRAIEQHLGASVEAERALEGWHAGWAAEFAASAQGLSRTFTHEILGFGGTLATLSGLLDRIPLSPPLAAAVAAYLALWVFMTGGILDRLARGRPVDAPAFFAACGGYFWRMLRLSALSGLAYYAAFAWLHPLLFGRLFNTLTRDATEERDVAAARAGLYVAFLLVLLAIGLVSDFAKVRLVVEDRRSALGAFAASLRFIRRRFVRTLALYAVNLIALAIILRLWLQVAPGASATAWVVLLAGQLYLLARVWARLAFMASEAAFFQGELAHAGYTAAPDPIWPDSPAVEALDNLRRQS
jgi:hypothetical protein